MCSVIGNNESVDELEIIKRHDRPVCANPMPLLSAARLSGVNVL
jgi:hypothetical protein